MSWWRSRQVKIPRWRECISLDAKSYLVERDLKTLWGDEVSCRANGLSNEGFKTHHIRGGGTTKSGYQSKRGRQMVHDHVLACNQNYPYYKSAMSHGQTLFEDNIFSFTPTNKQFVCDRSRGRPVVLATRYDGDQIVNRIPVAGTTIVLFPSVKAAPGATGRADANMISCLSWG